MRDLKRRTRTATLRTGDHGVALILVMLSLLVISVLTAALVFTARSETLASFNYRLDTQADYLAKAGIQQAVNWFRSGRYQALSPTLAPTDYSVTSDGSVFQLLTSNSQPVVCIANCPSNNSGVQFIGYGSGSSNYPTNTGVAVTANFASDLVNVSVAGNSSNQGTFSVNAILLNYQTVTTGTPPQVSAPQPVETWLVTSIGKWTAGTGGVVATAEEQAIVQPVYAPSNGNALYGYCSVTMNGSAGVCTDSFNSALGQYGGGNPSVASGQCDSTSTNVIDSGAGVGANGSVTLGQNVTVSGNITVGPGAGAGSGGASCGTGYNGSTQSVHGEVLNGPYQAPPQAPTIPGTGQPGAHLSSAPSYSSTVALPAGVASWPSSIPSAPPSTGSCGGGTICGWVWNGAAWALAALPSSSTTCVTGSACTGSAANPYLINSISISGNTTAVNLTGGPNLEQPVYYDIASLGESGQARINVSGYVVLNVQGSISITGNGITNGITGNIPPEMVDIQAACTGSCVSLGGNGAISAIITAPNATVSLGGGGSGGYFVGSINANTITDQGGYPVHYDIQLSRLGGVIGVPVVTAYSRRIF